MTKLVSKKDLKYTNGYIMYGDAIVSIGGNIVKFLNDVDVSVQKAKYIKSQPKGQMPPSLRGFSPKSERKLYQIEEPNTPKLDERAALSKSILDEMTALNQASAYNDYIKANPAVFEWLDAERVVVYDVGDVERFDLPTLGNPLMLTAKELIDIIKQYDDVDEKLLEE